eukprot:CAMPEP_0113935880 /NCGR_PEP_ID=MMETSP1339-20121228/2921_1 /TAXON_ID=94617 /ORGANISM="Fibrocapsa japonica" /LENGTH=228 /DNA_ID=CAMNT_0000938169 /DNA_START=36 /DNA_END=722 /DNA_ORIENTATION=+ /assembly_acc=CAM_ASM_000762
MVQHFTAQAPFESFPLWGFGISPQTPENSDDHIHASPRNNPWTGLARAFNRGVSQKILLDDGLSVDDQLALKRVASQQSIMDDGFSTCDTPVSKVKTSGTEKEGNCRTREWNTMMQSVREWSDHRHRFHKNGHCKDKTCAGKHDPPTPMLSPSPVERKDVFFCEEVVDEEVVDRVIREISNIPIGNVNTVLRPTHKRSDLQIDIEEPFDRLGSSSDEIHRQCDACVIC